MRYFISQLGPPYTRTIKSKGAGTDKASTETEFASHLTQPQSNAELYPVWDLSDWTALTDNTADEVLRPVQIATEFSSSTAKLVAMYLRDILHKCGLGIARQKNHRRLHTLCSPDHILTIGLKITANAKEYQACIGGEVTMISATVSDNALRDAGYRRESTCSAPPALSDFLGPLGVNDPKLFGLRESQRVYKVKLHEKKYGGGFGDKSTDHIYQTFAGAYVSVCKTSETSEETELKLSFLDASPGGGARSHKPAEPDVNDDNQAAESSTQHTDDPAEEKFTHSDGEVDTSRKIHRKQSW